MLHPLNKDFEEDYLSQQKALDFKPAAKAIRVGPRVAQETNSEKTMSLFAKAMHLKKQNKLTNESFVMSSLVRETDNCNTLLDDAHKKVEIPIIFDQSPDVQEDDQVQQLLSEISSKLTLDNLNFLQNKSKREIKADEELKDDEITQELETLAKSCRNSHDRTAQYSFKCLQKLLEEYPNLSGETEGNFLKQFREFRLNAVILMGLFRRPTFPMASKCLVSLLKHANVLFDANLFYAEKFWRSFADNLSVMDALTFGMWLQILPLIVVNLEINILKQELFSEFQLCFDRLSFDKRNHFELVLQFILFCIQDCLPNAQALASDHEICLYIHNIHLHLTLDMKQVSPFSKYIWQIYTILFTFGCPMLYVKDNFEEYFDELAPTYFPMICSIQKGQVSKDQTSLDEIHNFMRFINAFLDYSPKSAPFPRLITVFQSTLKGEVASLCYSTRLLYALLEVKTGGETFTVHDIFHSFHSFPRYDLQMLKYWLQLALFMSTDQLQYIPGIHEWVSSLADMKQRTEISNELSKFCLKNIECADKLGIYRLASLIRNHKDVTEVILFNAEILNEIGYEVLERSLSIERVYISEMLESKRILKKFPLNSPGDFETILKFACFIFQHDLFECSWLDLWLLIMQIVIKYFPEYGNCGPLDGLLNRLVVSCLSRLSQPIGNVESIELFQFFQHDYLEYFYVPLSFGQPLPSTLLIPFLMTGIFPVDFSLSFYRSLSFNVEFIDFLPDSIASEHFWRIPEACPSTISEILHKHRELLRLPSRFTK